MKHPRLLSLVLAGIMMAGVCPVTALAEETETLEVVSEDAVHAEEILDESSNETASINENVSTEDQETAINMEEVASESEETSADEEIEDADTQEVAEETEALPEVSDTEDTDTQPELDEEEPVLSEAASVNLSGSCGAHATWRLIGSGSNLTLTISGRGAMYPMQERFVDSITCPWESYKSRITRVVVGNGITSIGADAFSGCSYLKSVTLPNSLTDIGWDAFNDCGLTNIALPNGVDYIGRYAFANCSRLTNISIPTSVTYIDYYAFQNSGLTNIGLPDGVEAGLGLFNGCRSLKTVIIPSNATVYDLLFYGCSSVNLIRYGGTRAQWNSKGVSVPSGTRIIYNCATFSDVFDPSTAYFTPVYWGADNGIIGGYNDGTFRPWNGCTRASVVAFLWRLAGSPSTYVNARSPFSDVDKSNQFYAAIMWAYNKGIITGYDDGTFRPWRTCNRASIITFLWRYQGRPIPTGSSRPFTDMTSNNDFNQAMRWAYSQGISTGYVENGSRAFHPWDTCTRSAIVQFIYRIAH